MTRAFPDKENIGCLEKFSIFFVKSQSEDTLSSKSMLLCTPVSGMESLRELEFSNIKIQIEYLGLFAATNLEELIFKIKNVSCPLFDFLIVQPSNFWLYSFANLSLSSGHITNTSISDRMLNKIFAKSFSASVISHSNSMPIYWTGYSVDPALKLSKDLVQRVNQFSSFKFNQMKNVFPAELQFCMDKDHFHPDSKFCPSVFKNLLVEVTQNSSNNSDSKLPPEVIIKCNSLLLDEGEVTDAGNVHKTRTKCPYVVCSISGHQSSVLLDTGSEVTLISEEFFHELQQSLNVKLPTLPVTNLCLKGATGIRSKKVTLQTFLDLTFNNQIFPFPVLIVPSVNLPFILGIDFLKKYQCTIDCMSETLGLLDGQVQVPWIHYDSQPDADSVATCVVDQTLSVNVFADSHGRDLFDLLCPLLPETVQIDVDFKPGAKFNAVVKKLNVEKAASSNQINVIIAGTNDINPSLSIDSIKEELDLSIIKDFPGPLIICDIFPRFDMSDPEISSPINNYLHSKLSKNSNIHFLSSKYSLKKYHFTRHGLHLNGKGKKVLAKLIADQVESIITSEVNGSTDIRPQLFHTRVTEIDSFENLLEDEVALNNLKCNTLLNPKNEDLTIKDIKEKVEGVDLSQDQKDQLINLLDEYKDVFSDIPGRCRTFEAKLRVKDKKPFIKRSFPIPFAKRKSVRVEIDRLLRLGIIERSNSPYSNPIVPVGKKDGAVRLCLDARILNPKLVSDSEAPELVDSLLSRFSNPQFISTLDCTASFHQIPLAEDSRDYVSFSHEGRNYRFCVVPFGLCVSMQLFIKAMDSVFGPETEDFLSRYIDDFRIVSSSFEEHLEHLSAILSAIKNAGMTLKFSKCCFIQDEIDFLGFLISKYGIRKNPEKVRAIMDFPIPKNVRHLQSFLGLVNFYRKFHQQHSDLVSPLLHLLKKDVPWSWSIADAAAFEKIKEAFANDIMLNYPDFSKPLFLNTDASLNAISGELFQVDDEGLRRPLVFYSRTLSLCERNYTVTELELLAIVACAQKFRQFMLGHKTTIMTDHHALTFLQNCVLSTGRLTRWSLFLQEYDLEIKYIKGPENVIADTLSRYPPELHRLPPNNLEINVNPIFRPKLEPTKLDKICNHVLKDPHLGKIVTELKEKNTNSNDLYTLHDGNLFFKDPKTSIFKLCIPKSLENETIQKTHQFLGHLGINKVYNYLRTIAIFPGMRRKISSFVRSCLDCQQSKVTSAKTTSQLHPVLASKNLELVSVDLFGPLPKSYGNFQNVLVVLDVFSKFVQFLPVRNATGVLVTRKFISSFVDKFGAPENVISDHGPCFRSHFWDKALKSKGTQPKHTSVYHPQSNPVERYMRILGEFCRLYCHGKHGSWSQYLTFFQDCLNNSVSESTGFTPIEIFLGIPPINFLKQFANFPPNTEVDQNTKFVLVQENLSKSARKREKHHALTAKNHGFREGDKVLLRTHHLSNAGQGEIAKFFRLYEGPLVIDHAVGVNAYKLKDPDSGNSCGVHNVIYLKKFF